LEADSLDLVHNLFFKVDDHTSWFRFTTGVPLNNLFFKVDDHTLWFWFKTGVPAAKTKN